MADSDFFITISGPALSLLFYENVRSCGSQMGFLLGETLEFVTKTYTDADNQVETVKTYSNIEAIVTCTLSDILLNSIGKINKEKLRNFLGDKSKQVIGWFHFKQDMDLVLTFRNRILHTEFASYFTNKNGSKIEYFVTCLLSSSRSSEKGTHKFKHIFLRNFKQTFVPVPLRISNLGSNPFVHEGSDYKPTPTKNSSNAPDAFTKLIKSLNLDLTKISGVEAAIIIQKAAEQHLNQLIPALCESDYEVAKLEKLVKEFKLNSNNVNKCLELENDNVREERPKLQESFPTRFDNSDEYCRFKDYDTATSQTITQKPKNTVTCIEKIVNQNILKDRNATITNSPSQGSPPVNSGSEMKIDAAECALHKNRSFSNMESEIVKESICKNETNISSRGRGRGRGRFMQEVQLGLSNFKLSPGPTVTTRSNSERISNTYMLQQECEANSEQNVIFQTPHNQITNKKVDNARKSDTTHN